MVVSIGFVKTKITSTVRQSKSNHLSTSHCNLRRSLVEISFFCATLKVQCISIRLFGSSLISQPTTVLLVTNVQLCHWDLCHCIAFIQHNHSAVALTPPHVTLTLFTSQCHFCSLPLPPLFSRILILHIDDTAR